MNLHRAAGDVTSASSAVIFTPSLGVIPDVGASFFSQHANLF
jgi:hypothetical protein